MEKVIEIPEPAQADVFEPDPLQAVEPYEREEDRTGYPNGTV